MTRDEALDRLRGMHDPATWKLHEKNGAAGAQIGVKMGDIRKLAKAIRKDHALALKLWETGIIEARLLAVLVMVPDRLSAEEVDGLVRSNGFGWVADWLMSYVVKVHPGKEALREGWMAAEAPWAARAGWSLTAEQVEKAPEGLDLGALLDRIERELAGAPAPVQWTMNNTLAAIGIHHAAHRARAVEIGERLGVFRDYPTPRGCTSPFAPLWIAEMVRRAG
jgi:3-methyladenine DNA glycosylase AlkD